MYKLGISYFLASIVTLLLLTCLPSVSNGEKPTLPLAIEARLLNNPAKEGVAKIKVTLTSSVNIPNVSVSCDLPHGIGLSEGVERWEGALGNDKPEEIFYTIPVVGDKYYKIEFAATMTLNKAKGTIYAIVEVNSHNNKKKTQNKLKTKRLPDGKKVIEFKGE